LRISLIGTRRRRTSRSAINRRLSRSLLGLRSRTCRCGRGSRRSRIKGRLDLTRLPLRRFLGQPRGFQRLISPALRGRSLHEADIKYVFLGKGLGARTEDTTCYVDGQVNYGRLASDA
jgi:hypothetical protein